jgi:putative heme-binding domain-containing protein
MPRLLCAVAVAAVALLTPIHAQPKPAARGVTATPADQLKVAKGFKVELLYSVPKEKEGSWVCMTTLPDGRLVVSDQYDKGMYVVTPPAVGRSDPPKVEPMGLKFDDGKPFGGAQGLCWAFDALYVVVNQGKASGLYRVTDADEDGKLDKVELLRTFEGHAGGGLGEHGPHAVMKHPDGKRLTVVCGNQTKLTSFDTSKVPLHWGEDHLLPRLPDGNGFMAGVNGPGGAIYNVRPDGKGWELFAVGFRNQYDAAYDRHGDLFTYDADMEWDVNTPWYRPTRICHVTAGAEFGWRNGAGKYPAYYPDNLPGLCDIGPGSPTGVCFGHGAKFPTRYQDALFACDWSYGKLYAIHKQPTAGTWEGKAEEFVTGSPLPLTDIVVNETDGAVYFTTGGRRVQSGLYRVTFTGKEDAVIPDGRGMKTLGLQLRRTADEHLGKQDPKAVDALWPGLEFPGRAARFSTRAALEFQDTKQWADKALAEKDPTARITALLALTRVSASCPQHDPERKQKGDPALRAKILTSLGELDFAKLTTNQRLDLTRVYHVLFNRFGPPTTDERTAWLAKYEPAFPTGNRFVDGELLQVFVYLQGPKAAAKGVKLLTDAPTQEEQMEYARALRVLRDGWTPGLRKAYFDWFTKALTYKGGNSFAKFVTAIKFDAIATLTDADKVALLKAQIDGKLPFSEAEKVAAMKVALEAKAARFTDAERLALVKGLLEAKTPEASGATVAPPRPFVKKHTLDDLAPKVEMALTAGGRDFDKGRKLFAAANCFACHRYDQEGGATGPDLTGVSGRFSPKDLLESVLDPSKEVSDQYQAVDIDTLDGKKVSGRIVNLNGDDIRVMVNMLDPNGMVTVKQSNVDRITPSKVSMMPAGLLDTLTDDEAIDLMAYLLSRGDRTHPAFKK